MGGLDRSGACRAGTTLFAWLVLAAVGCEGDDPTPTGVGGSGGGEPACAADATLVPSDGASCQPAADDYQPRVNGSADDSWPPCISDDDAYHPFDVSISANVRTGAFEAIAALLGFGQGKSPSPQDFVDARLAYSEPEGLDSRISRREDEHYPPAPSACRDLTAAEQQSYADRCVGGAQILPLLNQAFEQGIQGNEPARNAARIEAALLWFFYTSVYKESKTCTDTTADCDSATGYYAGGQARSPSLGFARYVEARSPQAHDATWDALLAVRCWRDLDNPSGVATDLGLRDQALGQLDRALDRDLALILRQRFQALPCDTAWETLRILGPVLDRAASAVDPAEAAILRAEVAKASEELVDAEAAMAALEALFPCP
jgi:hypothetical protein